MSKKIEMTPYEASLFSEMKKLSKRANQRIVRLERETGVQEAFATKQLADYLSSEQVKGWTAKGRVTASKSLSATQMKAIIKATKQFLKADTSRVAGAKQYVEKISKQAGFKVPYHEASSMYQAERNYTWIYEYFGASEKSGGSYFWDFAREARDEHWDKETFIDNIMVYLHDRVLDEKLRADLEALYSYALGVNG